jgi:DNA polymerase-1
MYYLRLRGVGPFKTRTINFAYERGYVTTLIGRRRYLPELRMRDRGRKASGERISVNTRIQGSAADIMKIAMRNIREEMEKCGWFGKDAFMLMQVHDELVFEVRLSIMEEFAEMVKRKMENAVKLKVPIEVKPEWGANWKEAH